MTLDDDVVLLQKRKQPGVFDRRKSGTQGIAFDNALRPGIRCGRHQLLGDAVPGHWLLQLGRDFGIGQDDFADVSGPHLLVDDGVRNGDALGVPLRIEDRVELVRHQSEEEHRDRPGRNAGTPFVARARSARSDATAPRYRGPLGRGLGRSVFVLGFLFIAIRDQIQACYSRSAYVIHRLSISRRKVAIFEAG